MKRADPAREQDETSRVPPAESRKKSAEKTDADTALLQHQDPKEGKSLLQSGPLPQDDRVSSADTRKENSNA